MFLRRVERKSEQPSMSMDEATVRAREAMKNNEEVSCPECGELVNLGDVEAAMEHMKKHPEALARAQLRTAVHSMTKTGILREVRP